MPGAYERFYTIKTDFIFITDAQINLPDVSDLPCYTDDSL